MVGERDGPTHRQRQALATKDQVARAARGLFSERGYVPTTIAAIAESADIPAPTIYSAFGGKATILQHLAHLVVSELEVDRVHDDAIAHPDPAAGLRMAAGLQRRQFEVMYDVIAIYQEAARVDTEIARAQQVILANRERAFRRHLTAIARHLTPRVTVDQAVDIYVALVVPEIYRTLVLERGWAPDRYEAWLGDALVDQLLTLK
jgi:AcrR family transcriptional regulator